MRQDTSAPDFVRARSAAGITMGSGELPASLLEIPPALEQIVMDCLSKHPSDRPGSADELAQRLQGTGVAAGWTSERARRWWERHLPEHMQSKGLQTPVALAEEGLSGA